MNVRILKKKSKAAYEFGKKYGFFDNNSQYFKAEKGENYHGLLISCKCKSDKLYCCEDYSHPLKGTWMSGGMQGYYEPEWSEHTVYTEVREVILWGDDKPPKDCSEEEYRKIKRLLDIQPTHFQAVQDYINDI